MNPTLSKIIFHSTYTHFILRFKAERSITFDALFSTVCVVLFAEGIEELTNMRYKKRPGYKS